MFHMPIEVILKASVHLGVLHTGCPSKFLLKQHLQQVELLSKNPIFIIKKFESFQTISASRG